MLDGFDHRSANEQGGARDYIQPVAVATTDLRDHLLGQLREARIDERTVFMTEEVIGNIDDDGLLDGSLDDVVRGINEWLEKVRAEALDGLPEGTSREDRLLLERQAELRFSSFSVPEAEVALRLVQSFDPPGRGGEGPPRGPAHPVVEEERGARTTLRHHPPPLRFGVTRTLVGGGSRFFPPGGIGTSNRRRDRHAQPETGCHVRT